MDAILTPASAIFNFAIQGVTTVVSTIVASPLLLIFVVGLPLCGIAVGMVKRLTTV